MKTEKTSGQLRELFRVAYVENQDQTIKMHDLDRFLNPCITMRMVKKGEDIVIKQKMVAGHLDHKHGYYYMVLSLPNPKKENRKLPKWFPTGIPYDGKRQTGKGTYCGH